MKLKIVIFGLSITSSWGNGHATTYRALVKGLSKRGHSVTFLECEAPWYREHRDLHDSPYCRVETYKSLQEIPVRFGALVTAADLVMLGSYVPAGAILGDWLTMQARGVTAFYDIDTPVTLARLDAADVDYISPALIPRFDLYLSFTGGPALQAIEDKYGSPRARPLYCSVDTELHAPTEATAAWDLGYLGTYSEDRQRNLERLLLEPARCTPTKRFIVAGAQYPDTIQWPANVERVEHLDPGEHAAFYASQRYTLNITRAEMIEIGYSPSVRLFEAAACGVPIITDRWPGLDTFFMPGQEILIADSSKQVLSLLQHFPEEQRLTIAAAARSRVLREHTAEHRARQLEHYVNQVASSESHKMHYRASV
jgi:spore maturation protein CgeB